eukprot:5276000-Pleurochrysis_carterae.AAC.2
MQPHRGPAVARATDFGLKIEDHHTPAPTKGEREGPDGFVSSRTDPDGYESWRTKMSIPPHTTYRAVPPERGMIGCDHPSAW